jgi:ethanolamine utilization microcompartment shell protein EutS
MSKILAAQRRNILKTDGFFPHKANKKGNTVIWSRKHPTAKFVRVVVDSGVDAKSGKITGNAGVKLCYINRVKGWREITTEIFTDAKGLASLIKKVEAAEKFVKSCKFCKAKKFKAKTGNTVCANACWTAWAGKKKAASTKKKSSQKKMTQSAVKKAARNPQKVTPKSQRTYPRNKSSQRKGRKNLQRFSQEILPGDLVTIEEFVGNKVATDYTGSVLGIVQKVKGKRITTVWTANTAMVPVWLLPETNEYEAGALKSYRYKVLSRKVEWVKVA